MSTSLKRSHGALSNLGPAATNGGDQLWKFQIRKENQVILEKIEALTKAGQALPDQLNKRFNDSTDMIEALAAKVTKIENDTKQIMEERDKSVKERDTSVKEIARLRNQMQTLFQMLSPEEDLNPQWERLDQLPQNKPEEHTGQGASRIQPVDKITPSTTGAAPLSKATPVNNPPTTSANTMPARALKTPQPAAQAKNTAPQTKATPTNSLEHIMNPASSSIQKPTRRPANRKPSAPPKTHTTRSKKATNTSPTPKPLRLMQGPGSLSSYYTSTGKTHSELKLSGNSPDETEFVNAFIAGVSSEKQKSALIAQLKQDHTFRTKKGGKDHIMCQWEDIEEGLVKAGLLPAPEKADGGPSKKRRTLGDVDFVRG